MSNLLRPILWNVVRHPRRVAVIDDRRSWRYVDLLGGAFHIAKLIEQTSSARHVGIMLPTSGAFPMALLAVWMLGRVAVPVNYLLGDREKQFIVDDSDIDTIITAGAMLDFLKWRPQNVQIHEIDRMQFKGIPPLRWPASPRGDQLAGILYTSGTSGEPKGVMLTHQNLYSNVTDAIRHARLSGVRAGLGVLPQFHSFGLTALTLLPLYLGCQVIYTARFNPAKIVQLLREHRPDIFMGIPAMYNALLNVKDVGPDDFKSLRYPMSGGDALPRSLAEGFEQRYHKRILEGYGLTETSPVVALAIPEANKPGSVGRIMPQVEVRIVDDHGNDVPAGQPGEILIRGPKLMAGYFKRPDLTREVIDSGGWFHTGDWGRIDEEGYLYITGRKKEMLIIGGENVFPREIEEVLNAHGSVKASAVIGRADASRGQVPLAFVEMEEGRAFDEGALRSWCRQGLAGFKVPKEIIRMDTLPRSPTGKILRRQLQPPDTGAQLADRVNPGSSS
jgi:long-chain acyl-CoA synthetase